MIRHGLVDGLDLHVVAVPAPATADLLGEHAHSGLRIEADPMGLGVDEPGVVPAHGRPTTLGVKPVALSGEKQWAARAPWLVAHTGVDKSLPGGPTTMRDRLYPFHRHTGRQLDRIEHGHPVVVLVHGVVAVDVFGAPFHQPVSVVAGRHGIWERPRRERSAPVGREQHPRRPRSLFAHNQLYGSVDTLDSEQIGAP